MGGRGSSNLASEWVDEWVIQQVSGRVGDSASEWTSG